MKLRSLSLTKYGSFREAQQLNFPEEPGLYFMQGRNLVDPRLGGNGAGKSTIWNALHWLAYGNTPDGRKAGDIANWDAGKGTSVSLDYVRPSDGSECDIRVTRTWGPISWTMDIEAEGSIDLTKSESNPFLADIGATAKVFQQCVMMAQGEPMFLDLKRDAQAELFGAVLGLDRWINYSNNASLLAKQADNECRRLESEVARLEGKSAEIRDYGAELHQFEQKRRSDIEALLKDFDFCNSGLVADKAQLKETRAKIKEWEDLLDGRREKRSILSERLAAGEELIRDHEDQLRDEKPAAEHQLQRLKLFAEDKECPTCGMRLSDHHGAKDIISNMARDAEKLRDRVDGLRDLIEGFKQKQWELQQEYNDADEAFTQCTVELGRLDAKARNLRAEIDRANRRLDDIEEQVKQREQEVNPFKALQKDAQERSRTHQDALSEARQGLDLSNERWSLYSMWVRGFKEIRLQQIAEALTELEVEVNSSLVELGLEEWELRFDVDRETKGGSIQRGFAVTVLSPANKKPVPWESWSGGEQQRLRLAGNMGLANLIRSRMGVTFPLELWDEPTKGLSPEGVRDLLACLERRSRVEQRQIWVIDHTSHAFGGFAGVVTIVKDQDGSRIEQS